MRRSWLREYEALSGPCPSLQLHALGASWFPVQTIPLPHTPGVNTRVHLPRADPAQRPGLFQWCCTNVHVASRVQGLGASWARPHGEGQPHLRTTILGTSQKPGQIAPGPLFCAVSPGIPEILLISSGNGHTWFHSHSVTSVTHTPPLPPSDGIFPQDGAQCFRIRRLPRRRPAPRHSRSHPPRLMGLLSNLIELGPCSVILQRVPTTPRPHLQRPSASGCRARGGGCRLAGHKHRSDKTRLKAAPGVRSVA